MKEKPIAVRLTTKRNNKLRLYAKHRDITVTQVIEELVDTIKFVPPENGDLQEKAS
jgi:uncharacterized membrane protein